MIRIIDYNDIDNKDIVNSATTTVDVSDIVTEIIDNVKADGDNALKEYEAKFDGVKLENLQVSEKEIEEAFNIVETEFIEIIKKAAANITKFHKKQVRNSFIINDEDGILIGQKIIPIEKAGLYVPGGTAAYPSTVLMDSIPAKIAGCKEIVMVTPPMKDGKVNPVILATAKIAGVTKIFKVGGAQAIAALAYGTKSIPKVDKIVGPGNIFVAEAKKQVYGLVSIDMIAGPSEILVIADKNTNPKFAAADLLSQAEHDKNASAIMITDSMELASNVCDEIERQLGELEREEIARTSIDNNGKIIVVRDLIQGIEISNEIAPEHLELCMDNPFDYLDKVKNAGSVFMGRYCPEALGDYFAGPNHTLPTSRTARFSNPLSVDDFIKKTQYTYYTQDAFKKVAKDVAYFANKEGLTAHGKSALSRIEEE